MKNSVKSADQSAEILGEISSSIDCLPGQLLKVESFENRRINMKVIACKEYSAADVLKLEEVKKPVPGGNIDRA